MCGIIGYVGRRPAKDLLITGLERLEFRGYDSAGIALLEDDGLEYVRAVGNLAEPEARRRPERLAARRPASATRAGRRTAASTRRTRTRSRAATTASSRSCSTASSRTTASSRPSSRRRATSSAPRPTPRSSRTCSRRPTTATSSRPCARCTCASRATSRSSSSTTTSRERLVGVRRQTPLVVGLGDGENFLASNVAAFLAETRRVQYPDDGDVVEVTPEGVRFVRAEDGEPVELEVARDRLGRGGRRARGLRDVHAQGDLRAARGLRARRSATASATACSCSTASG